MIYNITTAKTTIKTAATSCTNNNNNNNWNTTEKNKHIDIINNNIDDLNNNINKSTNIKQFAKVRPPTISDLKDEADDKVLSIVVKNNYKNIKITREYPDMFDILIRVYASVKIILLIFRYLSSKFNI